MCEHDQAQERKIKQGEGHRFGAGCALPSRVREGPGTKLCSDLGEEYSRK